MNEPTPLAQPPVVQDVEAVRKSNRRKLIWALICFIGPTALIVISLLAYALVNFITMSTVEVSDEGFGATSPFHTIVNVLLFLAGAISVATWLPGIVVGIILLATRTRNVPHQ